MADYDVILLGLAVALAGGYAGVLYVRYRHGARGYPPERQWPGHGIDVTGISNRVHRLRNDYVCETLSRSRCTSRRGRLLTLARKAVCGLPYFRSRISLDAASNERDRESPSI